jgi:RNA polymerase sigma-70 factor (TIGR02943 family)
MLNNKLHPELWVKAYADDLYKFATKRIADPELCKDLVQDTFLAAIKNLSGFQGNSSERTWLTSILKNKIIDYHRKKATEILTNKLQLSNEKATDFFEENGHWKKKNEPVPWGIEDVNPLENDELGRILQGCMKKMPPHWAIVFRMKYMDEEDSAEICKELNLTPSNFWVIIHRAKLSLRACISKHWLR